MIKTTGFRTRRVFNAAGNGNFFSYRRGHNSTFWSEDGRILPITSALYHRDNILDAFRSRRSGRQILPRW